MAKLVLVHGAFNELWGPHEIKARWLPALLDGLWHHGATIEENEVSVAFYGDLFRRDPDARVPGRPDADEFAASRKDVAANLEGLTGEFNLDALSQATSNALYDRTIDMVTLLATQADLVDRVLARLSEEVDGSTKVIVGHSLGSVVAYEALRRNPTWPVTSLLTLGSPLGQPMVLSSIVPPIDEDGLRPWPGGVRRWTNVASVGDKPASVWRLSEIYGDRVRDVRVDNGHRAHAPEPYLNAHQTGAALVTALAD